MMMNYCCPLCGTLEYEALSGEALICPECGTPLEEMTDDEVEAETLESIQRKQLAALTAPDAD